MTADRMRQVEIGAFEWQSECARGPDELKLAWVLQQPTQKFGGAPLCSMAGQQEHPLAERQVIPLEEGQEARQPL